MNHCNEGRSTWLLEWQDLRHLQSKIWRPTKFRCQCSTTHTTKLLRAMKIRCSKAAPSNFKLKSLVNSKFFGIAAGCPSNQPSFLKFRERMCSYRGWKSANPGCRIMQDARISLLNLRKWMEMTTKSSSRDDTSNEKETWLFRVFFRGWNPICTPTQLCRDYNKPWNKDPH